MIRELPALSCLTLGMDASAMCRVLRVLDRKVAVPVLRLEHCEFGVNGEVYVGRSNRDAVLFG
jgi:hypothetical protein